MTRNALAFLLLACAPAVREAEPLDLDEPRDTREVEEPLTIRRSVLDDVLSKGPGRFFERVELEPYFEGKRNFVGFTLKTFYGGMTPTPGGVQVGDVVTAINGMPISRPEEFMRIWSAAGRRDELEVDVMRHGARRTFVYRVIGDPLPTPPETSAD